MCSFAVLLFKVAVLHQVLLTCVSSELHVTNRWVDKRWRYITFAFSLCILDLWRYTKLHCFQHRLPNTCLSGQIILGAGQMVALIYLYFENSVANRSMNICDRASIGSQKTVGFKNVYVDKTKTCQDPRMDMSMSLQRLSVLPPSHIATTSSILHKPIMHMLQVYIDLFQSSSRNAWVSVEYMSRL